VNWWLRSPDASSSSNYCNVNTNGNANSNSATNSSNYMAWGSSLSRQSNRKAKSVSTWREGAQDRPKGKYRSDTSGRIAACMAGLEGDVLFHAR